MARTVVAKKDLERIEHLVEKYNPRTHPLFADAAKILTEEELEDSVAYVAEEIPIEVGLRLLGSSAVSAGLEHGWLEPFKAKITIDYEGRARPHNERKLLARRIAQGRDNQTTDAISDAEYGLIQAAAAEIFGQ